MHIILKKIDQLIKQVPENYSKKERDAYLAACEAFKKVVIESANPVTIRRNETKQIKIRVDLDGRLAHRRRSDNRHPVRLVVYHDQKIKRYAISKFKTHLSSKPDKLYFFQDEWKNLWTKKGSRIKKDLERFEKRMAEIVRDETMPFSFEKFEQKMGLR